MGLPGEIRKGDRNRTPHEPAKPIALYLPLHQDDDDYISMEDLFNTDFWRETASCRFADST